MSNPYKAKATINNVVQTFNGEINSLSLDLFSGLRVSDQSWTLLDGDSRHGYWWYSVGTTAVRNTDGGTNAGIHSYASESKLNVCIPGTIIIT